MDELNDDDDWTQSTSPWKVRQPCIWPLLDSEDGRVCTGTDGNGNYQCPQYHCPQDKCGAENYDKQERAVCGSNFDKLGNARFVDGRIMRSIYAGVFTGT